MKKTRYSKEQIALALSPDLIISLVLNNSGRPSGFPPSQTPLSCNLRIYEMPRHS